MDMSDLVHELVYNMFSYDLFENLGVGSGLMAIPDLVHDTPEIWKKEKAFPKRMCSHVSKRDPKTN